MNHLPNINISVIPQKKQRYDTAGDYYEKGGVTHFRVSKMCANHEFLLLLHELIEWYLTKQRGITIKQIDHFDFKWKEEGEPGDNPQAPYYEEHQFATIIERMVADKLGVDWNKYNNNL